jgi:hypothetical protein
MKSVKWTLAGGMILSLFLLLPQASEAKQKGQKSGAETPALENPFFIGLGLGAGAPLSGWDSNYLLSGGGILFMGYRLDSSLSIQLDVDQWLFTGGGVSTYDLRVFPMARWTIEGKGFRPYFLAGPGYDIHSTSPSGYSTSALAAMAGAGMEYDLGARDRLFLEIHYNLLSYQDVMLQDIPVILGLSDDL